MFSKLHYIVYCIYFEGRLYSLQKAMSIDKKSPEARTFLMGMMDFLEKVCLTKEEKATPTPYISVLRLYVIL